MLVVFDEHGAQENHGLRAANWMISEEAIERRAQAYRARFQPKPHTVLFRLHEIPGHRHLGLVGVGECSVWGINRRAKCKR